MMLVEARRKVERERIAGKRAVAAKADQASKARSKRSRSGERTKRYRNMEIAQAVKLYAHRFLRVPTGLRRGKPVELLDWQVDYLAGLFAPDTAIAALTLARKNGKTGLLACLILAYLDDRGPLHESDACILAASTTEALANVLAGSVQSMARASEIELKRRQIPRPTSIEGAAGARLVVLPAERTAGAHGQSADLAVIDEAGLFESRLREALGDLAEHADKHECYRWASSCDWHSVDWRRLRGATRRQFGRSTQDDLCSVTGCCT